jgi:hypothetical protein
MGIGGMLRLPFADNPKIEYNRFANSDIRKRGASVEPQQASETTQLTNEQALANTLDRLQIRLYLARRGMQRSGLIFLGGVLLTIAAYVVFGSTGGLFLICLAPAVIGVIDFIKSQFRYNKYKKALAEFTDEHAAIMDNIKATLASNEDEIPRQL